MKRLTKILVVSLVLLVLTSTAFGAGMALGLSGLASAPAGEFPAQAMGRSTQELPEFRVFWQAWDIVHDDFVDRAALDTTELEYGAIRGMILSLGDEGHTTFLTPEELARQRSDISGKFTGIGAYLGVRDGLPMIVSPFEGSPAEQAGVLAGDIIMEVNGEDVTTWDLSDVVDAVRGPEATEVTLTLLRPEAGETLEVSITRGQITVPAVTWAMVPDSKVAMIRISQFSANANEELKTAIREARAAGATSLIVDVRNNPGGLLDQVVRVSSQFLEAGNVLQQEDADGKRKAYPVRSGGLATDIPMVVLANEGSASSSEIFAGAIQDQGRGLVVGETTFGTGTVLEPFSLDDGSGLLLGTSQWLTANGRLIRKQGIEPDVSVELPITADLVFPSELEELNPAELLQSEDTQILKALELLDALPEGSAERQPLRLP